MVTPTRKLTALRYILGIGLTLATATVAILLLQCGGLKSREEAPPFPHNELRIAVDASVMPFAVYTDDGLEGIDIDIGEALGQYLGLPVRFANMSMDGLYDSLVTDQADVIISAVVMDPWRLHQVRYTQSYFDAGLVLVSDSLAQMDDLPNHSLSYEFGSVADSEVRRWLRRIDTFEIQPYELPEHALDAVRVGVADGALVDMVDVRLYLHNYPLWEPEISHITHVLYVIAVRIDRKKTFAQIQEALSVLQNNGTITKIIEDWL